MVNRQDTPRDLAKRMAHRSKAGPGTSRDGFLRQTFTLPRHAARDKARDFLKAWPKEAYMSEVESWRELPGDTIEFTMRRLPTAD
jgi:hypothetical protein